MNYGLLIDVILIALFLGCVYLCARTGLIKTVATLVAVVVAVGSSYFITQYTAPFVARTVVNPMVERALESSFEKYLTEDMLGALDSAADMAESLMGKIRDEFLPEEETASAAEETTDAAPASDSLFSDNALVAQKVTDMIGGALTATILFFVFYALIFAILRVLIDLLSFFQRIPIVGPVNTLLGLVLGILVGYALIALPVWALFRLLPSVVGDAALFSPETLGKSRVIAFLIGRIG